MEGDWWRHGGVSDEAGVSGGGLVEVGRREEGRSRGGAWIPDAGTGAKQRVMNASEL